MIDGGNGLTSWFGCFWRNKLTMFGAHCPFNSLTQLAESKVSPLLEKIIASSLESRTLASLRDTLLPKLMRGEVRVSEL